MAVDSPSTHGLDGLAEAQRLHSLAVTAIEGYQPELAASHLDRASALLTELVAPAALSAEAAETRARVRLAQAWTAFERRGRDRGEEVLADALEMARAQDRPDLEALCLMQGASMRGRSGDLPGSLALMRQAEVGLDLLPPADRARLVVNRGVIAGQLMQLDEARTDLARGAALAHEIGSAAMEFMAQHNQGYVEYLRGDLPAALALMDSADAMDVAVNRSVSLLDQARVLLEAGLLDEAAESLHRARTLADREGGGQDVAEIELDLARTLLLLGDPQGSARLAAVARRRFQERSAAGWRRRAQLVLLEAESVAHRRPVRTARLAAALVDHAAAEDDVHVSRRAALIEADARLDAGDLDGARAAYRVARPLRRSGSLPTRLHLRLVAARMAALDVGGAARASRSLADAADDLARAQRRVSSLDLRTALSAHSNRLALMDLGLGVASGSVAALFTRAERWRAVSDRVPLVRPPRDERAAELLTRLRRVREDLRDAPPPAQEALRGEAAALERRIRSLDWASPEAGPADWRPARPLPYAAALAVVRATEATLVSFVPHGPDLYAVHVTARRGRIVRVGALDAFAALVRRVRADVEAAALPGIGPVRAAVETSLAAGLGRLDEILFGPAGAFGPTGRLVVVPSRAVAGVPWGMLPSRHGRPTTLARTASAWIRSTQLEPLPAPRVLAIAGPDLQHADREAAEVAAVWGGRLVPSTTARLAEVVGALADRDLIHIAAHGRHHAQSPLFSTLRLADGPAFAHELPDVGVGASHVVLSACEVGRATVRVGDESLGLAAVLLSLGVRTVVAATSRIPDELAAEAMTAYHRRLATGVDSALALAEATAGLPLAARAFSCLGADWRAAPTVR